jgi:uncharacterized protein YxeA
MNSKTKTILSLIIFVLFLAGAYFVYNGFVNKSQPDTGNTQPPGTVQQNSDAQPDENNGSDAQPDENNGSGAEGVTEDETEQSEKKLKALDFTVYDKEGNKVNLSDFCLSLNLPQYRRTLTNPGQAIPCLLRFRGFYADKDVLAASNPIPSGSTVLFRENTRTFPKPRTGQSPRVLC